MASGYFFQTQLEQANLSEESKYLNSANNYLTKELTQTKTPTHTHVLVHAQHVTANLTLRNQGEKIWLNLAMEHIRTNTKRKLSTRIQTARPSLNTWSVKANIKKLLLKNI